MKKIKNFRKISEMTDKQKMVFTEYLHSNAAAEIKRFFQSNKDYIKKVLSTNNARVFEKEVLNKDQLQPKFLQHILERLDEKRYETFENKTFRAILKSNKELAKSILEDKQYEEKEMIKFLANLTEEKRKETIGYFDCLGLEIDDYSDEIKEEKENQQDEESEKLLAKKDKEIERLHKQIEKNKEDFETKLNKTKESYESKLNKAKEDYDTKIAKVEEANKEKIDKKEAELKNTKKELEHAKGELKEIKGNKSLEEIKQIIEDASPKKPEPVEVATDSSGELKIDFEDSLNDLESRTLLGVVKAEDIQLEKSWIIVHPIVPIITENSNIDRDRFINEVDYRSDYSSFVLYINQPLLDMALPKIVAEDYQFYTNDEKYNCLFEAFCKKILFFLPQFVEKANGKRKLNAKLMKKPVPYEDFNNSTFVPAYDGTKSEFENKVKNHENLMLHNYPYSLSSYLKYVYVVDTIYEINYVPHTGFSGHVSWKYNGQVGDAPFRKLGIKINSNESSDKYILTPSIFFSKSDDLYVKNIAFIQASTKNVAIFDEGDFISDVNQNAKSENLYYTENDLKNFHIAIKSSNLVILAGPSGIGKTRLPIIYANALGLDFAKKTLLFVPISPSYLEPEDVLGYIRPINADGFDAEYMESQTGLVSFLIDAEEHKDKIHMVIFDEMNLSQIEHWFAPFISILEQDPDSRTLNLYSENLSVKNGDAYPPSINIGKNVFFVGTINIDETTKQISDRLLDRAIVINLAMPSFNELKNMGSAKSDIYPEVTFSRYATSMKQVDNSTSEFKDNEFALINDLNALLVNSVANKSISFRSLRKMAIYLRNSAELLSRKEAFDFVVAQIVVKKLTGSREELEEILSDDDTQGILKILNDHRDVSDFAQTKKVIQQKIQELSKYGFTR